MPRSDDPRFGEPASESLTQELAAHGIALGEFAGRGGSGQVYRGTLTRDGAAPAEVAVKVLLDHAEVGRIVREAESLRRLDHGSISRLVDVIDLTPGGGMAALVTEWAEGAPLSQLLRTSAPLAPARAMAIFAQLAAALDHAHDQDVVHRDVSPDNVMVDANDHVTLIDFGLSRTADSATLTADGITAGTPRYLAPEVIAGADATAASDAYSAAIIFYEMLTGHWPYGDTGATISTAIHHHLNTAPTPPSEANPWLAPSLDVDFDRALDKEPAQRFSRVGDLFRSVETSVAHPASDREPRAVNRRRTGPGRAAFAAAAVALVGLAAVGLWLFRSSPEVAPTELAAGLISIDAWPSGTAAALPCNLLSGTGFADGTLPPMYYVEVADRNEPVDFGGVDSSAAMRVGTTELFGLYGETIAVLPGVAYAFSAHVSVPVDVDRASIRLFWLDENYEEVGDVLDFPLEGTRQVTLLTDAAPPATRFAVPSLIKESSPGSLVIDELVFADRTAPCAARLVGR